MDSGLSSSDEEAIKAFSKIYSNPAPSSFTPSDIDEFLYDAIAAGYSDGVEDEVGPTPLDEDVLNLLLENEDSETLQEELEIDRISEMKLGVPVPVRGVFEGNFMPTEFGPKP